MHIVSNKLNTNPSNNNNIIQESAIQLKLNEYLLFFIYISAQFVAKL